MNITKKQKCELIRSLVRFGLMVGIGCAVVISFEDARAEEPSPVEARKVIARVNGQPIYEDQIKPAVEKTLKGLRRHGAPQHDPQLVKRVQSKLLSKTIGDVLVHQESEKRTVENMDEKVEQRVKDLERKYGAGQGMEMYLKIRRTTMDDLRESLRERVRVDEYLKEQRVLEPEIPEDRIRDMYELDPKSFTTTATATVSHILISAEGEAGPEEKDGEAEGGELRQEILAGKDFAELAKQHSDCKSATAGGNLGQIKKGFMPAEFEKVAFSLENGTVSEVVETKFGYHVIKVVDNQPARIIPYEGMRDFLKKYLQDEESKKKLASHMGELKKRSEIEILLK